MMWFKRIGLFVLTNILVIGTVTVVMNLLGVQPYLTAYGINYEQLLIFCLVWGFGGAFISLGLSRIMAKMMMGVKVIKPSTHNPDERELVDMVHRLAKSAGLTTMPEVGVYESPEVNAFATGPTRSRSLVAVSRGLLQNMDKRSVEGVLGHEVAHIANGDMVTMTLLQGVVNAFVMFMARVIAFAIDQFLKERSENGQGLGGLAHMFVVIILEVVFMLVGQLVVSAFSRYREFRADAGGAKLAGRENMVAALGALQKLAGQARGPQDSAAVQSLKISGGKRGFMALFSTHPPLEDRIRRLQRGA